MRKANNGRLWGPIDSTAYCFSQALDIKTSKGDKIRGITDLRKPETCPIEVELRPVWVTLELKDKR